MKLAINIIAVYGEVECRSTVKDIDERWTRIVNQLN